MQSRCALGGFAQHDLRCQDSIPSMTQAFQSVSHWTWLKCSEDVLSSISPVGRLFPEVNRGDWDFKGNTFPSNLRIPPPPVLVFGKQSQSKAKTWYLLCHLLRKVFPWEWQRHPSTISKGEGSKAEACSYLSGLQRQSSHFSQKKPDSLLREHWLLRVDSGNFTHLRIWRFKKKSPF